MKILLTNDDGYEALGLKLLYDYFSKIAEVVIVAPKTVMSAKSVSIMLGKAVEVDKIDDHTFAMEGTPADCVAFGLSSLNKKFDLVVSGCNHGLNISYDTMYSGTIGACLQALTFRVPAIAFSCENNFDVVEENLDKVMEFINNNKLLSTEYLLNVNFPVTNKVKDIVLTNLYYRKENTYYIHKEDNKYFATRDIEDEKCLDKNTDAYAIYHDRVSITKLSKSLEYRKG